MKDSMQPSAHSTAGKGAQELPEERLDVIKARRTAFVARFIVLRESKRTRAHRVIEMMDWDDQTTAEDLMERFRNGETHDDLGFPIIHGLDLRSLSPDDIAAHMSRNTGENDGRSKV